MEVKHADLLGTGRNQVILESGDQRAVVVPEVGGRIVELSYKGVNALRRLYPQGVSFGPYTEYGGIEEHVGSAPGSLWNVPWKCEVANGAVVLTAFSGRTLVRKTISLDDSAPILRIRYELANYSANFARFTFGIHPEIVMGGDHRSVRFHVPAEGEVLSGGYAGAGFRKYVTPAQGWCAATASPPTAEGGTLLFLQMFPERVVDSVEVYYPRVDTHLVLEPIIFGVGLTPQKTARFQYMAYCGPGDETLIPEIYAKMRPALTSEYEQAQPLPEDADIPKHEFARRGGFDIHPPEPIAPHADAVHAVREAVRQAETAVRMAMRGVAEGLRAAEVRPPVPPSTPEDLRQARMTILRGVEEGRYTVEEALVLLEKLMQEG
ncbi:MAG: hypothetical protein ACUVRO_13910 [Armatimonadota bacterium]